MNRAERRRVAADRPVVGLEITPGEVLRQPGHWHVDTVAYSHEDGGVQMNAIHLHNLVTNDLVLMEGYVLKTVRPLNGATRDHMRTEQATLCIDPAHYETAQTELLKPEV